MSNIKAKIKTEGNGNQKRFSTKIELKDLGKHRFLLKRKEGKPIHFAREEPKGKLTGQNEKEKTAKRPTKVKRRTFFGKGNYKINSPKRKRSNQKQATAKKITLFAGGKKGSNKLELDKSWDDARIIRKEKPHKKPTESKKLISFGKKKKDSMDGLSEINVSDKGPTDKKPTKIKRHAFFEKKKPLEKISDDHKTIEPLSSSLAVEKPFISPISETKFETVRDTEKQPPAKIELKDHNKHRFLLKRKEGKPIHFAREEPKGKLTGQNEKEKTAKRPTKVKRRTFFGKGNYKTNPPKRKRSNQKQAMAKKNTLFAGGKKGSNKIELDKAWGDARNIGEEKPYKKPTESKKLTFFSNKKKDPVGGLSEINARDKKPTKIKRHAFFEKKKPLEKISDDHKTIEPLSSSLAVEKPFISPISETKFETPTKVELKDPDKHKFLLKRKERKPIHFMEKKPKKEKPPKKLTESKKLISFGKKKKDSMDGLSGINVNDRGPIGERPTKIKRHAFFEKKKPSTNLDTINDGESTSQSKHRLVHLRKNWIRPSHKRKKETFFEKKKPLEKISDDHKTIEPLSSSLAVEKPFISPISETKFETVTDTEKQPPAKIELKDPDKHKFLLKRKERKPIHFMEKKPKKEKPPKKLTESKKLISFGKKKKDSMDGLSGINVNDRGPIGERPTKIKRHAFFEKKKPLGKISDDHKTIAPLPSDLDVEKPFISPISETKLETAAADGKINLENVERFKSNTLEKLGFSTEKSWTELDFYPLMEPFAYAEIIRDTKTLDRRYILMEIGLSGEESKNLKFIKETLSGFTSDTDELESKGKEKYLMEKIEQIIEDYMLEMGEESKKKIKYFLKKKFLGLDRLEPIMKDPNIEDISCDGSDVSLFLYHRIHGSLKSNVKFEDEDELSSFVVRLSQRCGKHISIASPMLDATMPDGSRIQMTLSDEVTTRGSTFTIRKFKEYPFSPADLIEFNTMSSDMMAYLWMAVENGISALFAGGTASGKTSSLNALALFIPPEAKIVSIEETREINLPHHNWIPGVSRSGFGEIVGDKVVGEIDLYDLMKAALRQRPEYILVGEIRGKEAYVLFQAMATGHTTYSTVHADSAKSLIHRLEGKPINIPRIMLQALDVICIQGTSRIKDKRVRRCKHIIEIIDIDPTTKEILTNEVFRWDPVEDKFIYSGKSYILERIRAEKDLSREEMTNEIKNRATLMEWMRKENIKDFKEVATMTANYIENPLEVMKNIGKDIQYV